MQHTSQGHKRKAKHLVCPHSLTQKLDGSGRAHAKEEALLPAAWDPATMVLTTMVSIMISKGAIESTFGALLHVLLSLFL